MYKERELQTLNLFIPSKREKYNMYPNQDCLTLINYFQVKKKISETKDNIIVAITTFLSTIKHELNSCFPTA